VAHLKLLIAKLRHERFRASSDRGRKLADQMELQVEERGASAPPKASRRRCAARASCTCAGASVPPFRQELAMNGKIGGVKTGSPEAK
jgi:transposase